MPVELEAADGSDISASQLLVLRWVLLPDICGACDTRLVFWKELMNTPARDNLLKIVLSIKDLFEDMLPDYAMKRRDRREPGRREKEAAEEALMLFLLRHFRKQAKQVRERMGEVQKAIPSVDDIFDDLDEDELAELIRLLTKNVRGGVTLFGSATGLAIDYTMTNQQAAEWARLYAGKLIRDIDKTSLDIVRRAVTQFVETPGFTIGDLMDLLPFDEKRALNIAVTEVTRTYAQGQMMAGDEMRAQFPDVNVVKRWFTNNDDLVCELCGPLDGVEVALDENFYDIEDDYQDGNPPLHVNCRCWISTSTALADQEGG